MEHGLITRHLKKKPSVTWRHPLPPPAKKFKVTPSGRKITETVFWAHNGVLLVDFIDRRTQWLLCIIVEYLRGYAGRQFVTKGYCATDHHFAL
jgi:hypothetical protein